MQLLCGDTGFLLGAVDEFKLIVVPALSVTLADTTYAGKRRVWMIVAGPDGKPHLEDLNSALAQAAGRGATADIDGLALDMSHTGESGIIAFAAGGANTLDLDPLVSRARVSLAEGQEQGAQQ